MSYYCPSLYVFRVVLCRNEKGSHNDPEVNIVAATVEEASATAMKVMVEDWKDDAKWLRVAQVMQVCAVHGISGTEPGRGAK